MVVNALLANPEYQSNWAELYRDFVRVQRIDEQQNAACDALRVRTTDAKDVAAWVRDQSPLVGGDGKAAPTFADVVFGSIELDDVTPIYIENLFTMVTKTYAGANALPVALELSRRSDFGAWFDGAYLNRDMVCLSCHNSEFSVTQSSDPAINRHFPVPGLFEKALFGDSTGPGLVNGFSGADRLHGAMRRAQFLVGPSTLGSLTADCATATAAQITAATAPVPTCASGDPLLYCSFSSELMCTSVANRDAPHSTLGLGRACGQFMTPDQAAHRSGIRRNAAGQRVRPAAPRCGTSQSPCAPASTSSRSKVWARTAMATSPTRTRRFAYLVSMNIVEKVWKEVVGTPLTIANYFPRNAAARDQLWTLTETFIKSGYSNKALLSAIFASPYLNMAAPETGCGNNPVRRAAHLRSLAQRRAGRVEARQQHQRQRASHQPAHAGTRRLRRTRLAARRLRLGLPERQRLGRKQRHRRWRRQRHPGAAIPNRDWLLPEELAARLPRSRLPRAPRLGRSLRAMQQAGRATPRRT